MFKAISAKASAVDRITFHAVRQGLLSGRPQPSPLYETPAIEPEPHAAANDPLPVPERAAAKKKNYKKKN